MSAVKAAIGRAHQLHPIIVISPTSVFSRVPDCRVKVAERFIFWLAEHSAPLLVVRGFEEISEHFHAQVRSHPASLILIAQGPGSTAVSPEVDPGRRGTTSRAVKV